MDNLENKNPPSSTTKQSFIQQLRNHLLANPLDHLPSLFLIAVSIFGTVTLISLLFFDLLAFPFILTAIISSLFAAWHIRILGSMKEQIELFENKNKQLSQNISEMEQTLESLKSNNNRLHQELNALQKLRTNLQKYADETKLDFSQLLEEANQRFQHLEVITIANERVLLQRIAQDLEFLDHEVGMQRDEYLRFVDRIPEHLQATFSSLSNTSFEQLAGNDQRIDHKELQTLVHQLIKKVS